MKAIVKEGCISCGMCMSVCPDVFRMNGDGFSEAYGKVTPKNLNSAKEAEESCPVSVIEIQK